MDYLVYLILASPIVENFNKFLRTLHEIGILIKLLRFQINLAHFAPLKPVFIVLKRTPAEKAAA